jgi:hypothetical protein
MPCEVRKFFYAGYGLTTAYGGDVTIIKSTNPWSGLSGILGVLLSDEI